MGVRIFLKSQLVGGGVEVGGKFSSYFQLILCVLYTICKISNFHALFSRVIPRVAEQYFWWEGSSRWTENAEVWWVLKWVLEYNPPYPLAL